MDRREFIQSAFIAGACTLGPVPIFGSQRDKDKLETQTISIRPSETKSPLPHIWEECMGSDRAIVGLREQWLADLDRTRKETGVRSVRFHGLFNDEMGVWPTGAKAPNFLYVDILFDAMRARGVKPLVELCFMPVALASGTNTAFFYKGNSTPPKEMAQWGELIRALASHCIERYGLEEVGTWNFEVWNEPNLRYFWTGTKDQYFELYRSAATALKSVDGRLRVGGPSTAQTAWVPDLLEFCSSQQVPIDFVSTHIYPDDPQKLVFGEGVSHVFEEVIPKALEKVKSQIKASALPNLPLYITEWSSQNPAFIAQTTKSCIGLAEMMSYWTFDNVFEELGVPRTFLNGGFGLIGMRGVPRPSFHTFSLLHKLGDVQLLSDEGPVLATRRKDGSLAILVWNLIPQAPGHRSSMGDPTLQTSAEDSAEGESKEIVLKIDGSHRGSTGRITRVDASSGSFRQAYKDMGNPAYPTGPQIEELKRKSEMAKSESIALNSNGEFSIKVPPNGVALLELPGH